MTSFYGPVGENQETLHLPYQMYLAWDKKVKVKKISCNKKCAKSLYNIFEKTLQLYGLKEITKLSLDSFGGCLNVRKMRGGPNWSVHAWGAAVDIDPERNRLKWGSNKASLAKKEYDGFWRIVAEEGWISLGKEKNFDWMHFQAALL